MLRLSDEEVKERVGKVEGMLSFSGLFPLFLSLVLGGGRFCCATRLRHWILSSCSCNRSWPYSLLQAILPLRDHHSVPYLYSCGAYLEVAVECIEILA